MMKRQLRQIAVMLFPLLATLGVILVFLVLLRETTDIESGPIEIMDAFWRSVSTRGELSGRKVAAVLEFWIPLTLASIGRILTFRAGLWNIGVEGQMALGGLAASAFTFSVVIESPLLMIPLSIIAAMLGGAAWALIAGVLRTRFGVNEIFSGVALNALANQVTLLLIAGPWRPLDSDKAQYSRAIPSAARLPGIDREFNVSVLALLITFAAILIVIFVLNRTRWGLNLKAVGRNPKSALLLGVPTTITALGAMVACGALAGIGGAHRILFTDGNVTSQFTGGIGFIGLLVVMLVGMRATWVPLVALIFTIMLQASTPLQFLGLGTAFVGVLQGLLVLLVILFAGARDRWLEQRAERQAQREAEAATALQSSQLPQAGD